MIGPMGLRESLREATREEHSALEALLALDRPALSLTQYRQYLRLTHGFYREVEPVLARAPALAALGLDMRRRGKRQWLEADLAFFGVEPVDAAAVPLDLVAPGRLIGCAYVLEGATLGGQVLQRALAPRWDLAKGRGGTFLEGYGERTGAMWRGFVAALDEASRTGADEAACVEGARETFLRLGDWFRHRGWS